MAESMPSALCIGPSTFKGRYMPETSHPPPLHLLPSETYKKVLEKVFGWSGAGGSLNAQVRLVTLSLSKRIQRARTSVRDCRQLPEDALPRWLCVPRRRRAWPETVTPQGTITLY